MFDLYLKRHTSRFWDVATFEGSKVNAGKVCGDRARPSMRSRTGSEYDWMQGFHRNTLLSGFGTIFGFTNALKGIQEPKQMKDGDGAWRNQPSKRGSNY